MNRVLLWDFDGTLADTRVRNFNVVRRLFGENLRRFREGIRPLRNQVNKVAGF